MPSRAYATDDSAGWDASSGSLDATGRDLDVAIKGPGWIAVQASDGTEAYTRAGDLHVDPNGNLTDRRRQPVLGDYGPITVPPYTSLHIGTDGSVSIVPRGQTAADDLDRRPHQAGQSAQRAGLARQRRPVSQQQRCRGADADASVHLVSGTLESSNVNIAETMANMIELARNYEVQVKAMKTAEDTAASSTKLLQSS